MKKISEQPWLRKIIITLAGKPLLNNFNRQSHNIAKAQHKIFKQIINDNKETVFGKEHNFDKIKTIEDYRKAVPISNFEKHRPYINLMMNGDSDILFPGKPILYNTTSGTTTKPKMIPISQQYFDKSIKKLNKLWLYTCLKDNPDIYNGKSLTTVSPAEEGKVNDGTPYGSISGVGYRNIPEILKSTYSGPFSLVYIKDFDKKFYATIRLALVADITIIIVPSPSNIIRFQQTVMENFNELVNDISKGTMKQEIMDELPTEAQKELKPFLSPNPKRADELKRLFTLHGKNLRPKHYWPNIACVNIWKQGNFKLLLPKLNDYFYKKTVLRAFGYQASEGRAGIILSNDWDYSVLAINVYLFEFIEEKNKDLPDPPVLLAHELEVGKRYYIIFSNNSGLYRYDMNDIVEICGFYNQIPKFKFIQKGEGITSITGEKLSEEQIIQTMKEIEKENNIGIENYIMYADIEEFNYKLYIEFTQDTKESGKKIVKTLVDEKLKKYNPEYYVKRESRRLASPIIYELCTNSYQKIKKKLVINGLAKEGQYKNLYLTKKIALKSILESLKKNSTIRI